MREDTNYKPSNSFEKECKPSNPTNITYSAEEGSAKFWV